jgi:membrane protease YdiL (CAAX protease family)
MGKNRWISGLVALVGFAILVLLFRYNKQPHSYEEYLVTNIAALFWLPIVLVTVVMRKEPASFGFRAGDAGQGYRLAAILYAVLLPVLVIAARMPVFQQYYPIQKQAARDLAFFGYFELTYGMYLFCWEFFFRGFLLFGIGRTLGAWSVLVQAIAFGFMHFGKPFPEFAVSFLAGIILGMLALRAKSFLPGFMLHWVAAVTFDIFVILAGRGMLF